MSDLSIVEVRHVKDHVLALQFSDGHVSTVDFAPFIFNNKHPDYEQYRDVEKFLAYDLDDGNLNWDDYTMIFHIENLYANKI